MMSPGAFLIYLCKMISVFFKKDARPQAKYLGCAKLQQEHVSINRYVPHSRPLREVSLVCDPSLIVSANCVVDIRTPWHVGKHFEQVLHLLWRQCTISILDHPECT